MNVGVIGTGTVGTTIGGKLAALGHEVMLGSRTRGPDRGTFADAAAFAELVVNATPGRVSLDALRAAGAENLAGKVLLDIANPLDFSGGFPPSLAVCNTDSLAEQIQRAFPAARVVKSLNTMNARVMVEPGSVQGRHDVFLSGDDDDAKAQVRALLMEFGWPQDNIVDLGGIATARGVEMFLPLWLTLHGALGDRPFNIGIARSR